MGTHAAVDDAKSNAFSVLKALADKTRFEIYCIVQDSPTPLSVQDIADQMGLHPNTIRPHLEKLKESGLIAIKPNLSGKVGRPLHLYSPASHRPPALMGDRALKILRAVIEETLRELISECDTSPEYAYELGKTWGRQMRKCAEEEGALQKSPSLSSKKQAFRKTHEEKAFYRRSLAALTEDLELLGFEPSVDSSDDELVVLFGDCPYRSLAQQAPQVVCTVHKAICEECLAWAKEGVEISEFHAIEEGQPCLVVLREGITERTHMRSRADAAAVKSEQKSGL